MKKSLKRLLCLVLSVLLFTMSLPVLAVDATEEPTTTAEVVEIYTAQDLRDFAKRVNDGENTLNAVLKADINLLSDLVTEETTSNETVGNSTRNNRSSSKYYDYYNRWGGEKSYSYYKETVNTTVKTNVESDYILSSSGDSVIVYVTEMTTTTTTTVTTVLFANRNSNNESDWYSHDELPPKTVESTDGPNSSGEIEIAVIDAKTGEVEIFDEEKYEDFTNHAWTPIGKHTEGSVGDGFNGTFDAYNYDANGNVIGAYTIYGLYINGTEDQVGLFGHVGTADIRGVRIQDSYIRGNDGVGAVVGFAHNGATIRGCWSANGTVVSGVNYVGGIVGGLDLETSDTNVDAIEQQDHIYECINRGYVYGNNNVGGVLGYGYHAIVKYSANMHSEVDGEDDGVNYTGHVIGNTNVGGIVGRAISTVILGCTNYATVQATGDYVGGIVGHLDRVKSYVRKAVNYNTASVTGVNYVGGLVGYFGEAEGVDAGTTAKLDLFTSYNDGTVSGTTNVGGLVGYNAARGQIRNSYNSGAVLINKESADVSATTNNGNVVGVNAGLVRDCFYYPNRFAAEKIDGATNALYNEKAIGNGIGSDSNGEEIHVSGIQVAALKSAAAAYLLNLVWMEAGADDHVTESGYHHLATHHFGDVSGWEAPTYWIAGENGPEFTTEASKAVKAIKGAQLVLNENFNITFKVDVPAGLGEGIMKDRAVTFIRHGDGESVTINLTREEITEKDGAYYFMLDDIKPHYLGDDVEVIFTAKYAIPEWVEDENGVGSWVVPTDETHWMTVSEMTTYSVKAYCERQLGRTMAELGYADEESYNAFRTLLCNVLEYGAQYQIYRNYKNTEDALVNKYLKDNELTATDFSTMEGTIPKKAEKADIYVGTRNPEFYIYSSAVQFGSENAMGFILYGKDISKYVDANGEDLILAKIMVSNGQEYTFTRSNLPYYGNNTDFFKAVTDTISANEYRYSYVLSVYAPVDNGDGTYSQAEEPNEVYTYNMEYFVAGLLAINDNRAELAKALWNYAMAVEAYQGPTEELPDDPNDGISLDTDNIFDSAIWDKIKEESGEVDPDNPDADGDGIPDGYVRLNISAGLARLLSYFNPILRWLFGFTIVEYPTGSGVYYAAPN